MNLLDSLKDKDTTLNTKGGEYFSTTYDANLDLFSNITRFTDEDKIVYKFNDALRENKELALANLLYFLDIRGGKGERRIFKLIFKDLCLYNKEEALTILPFIGELGRYDYILEGIGTLIEDEVVSLIKDTLENDLKSDNPSLLAKWLPSHRSHGKNNLLAKKLAKLLGITPKEYRKTLSTLRSKINLVEKNLTNKDYEKIVFDEIPAKAMLKYNKAYNRNMPLEFEAYKENLKNNSSKINTDGLFSYEIIKKILFNSSYDEDLYNLMWEKQKDVFYGNHENILVVADTSGSMKSYGAIPYCSSVGLAIYTAERNKGFFKNHFITFSEEPVLHEIKGKSIVEKVHNMKTINAYNTDIDKVFKLLLDTSLENNLKQEDLPSHILIISDMEFDRGVYSETGTNYSGWKKAFIDAGYKLPTIIFWNVSGNGRGVPVTKFSSDVSIVSGFSTNILSNLLTLDNYSPLSMMMEKLSIYLEMLNK